MIDQNTEALSVHNDIAAAAAQIPQYQCHKKVWALQITGVGPAQIENGSSSLFVGDKFKPIVITQEWRMKHRPEVGGYYVLYPDGYTSFSPKEAFESGYTRLTNG